MFGSPRFSQCMNPVFYFDELDKISDTQKGEEIIYMLFTSPIHSKFIFQDNYFPGINLDLSKVAHLLPIMMRSHQ